jgi:hypothetical protein
VEGDVAHGNCSVFYSGAFTPTLVWLSPAKTHYSNATTNGKVEAGVSFVPVAEDNQRELQCQMYFEDQPHAIPEDTPFEIVDRQAPNDTFLCTVVLDVLCE